MTAMSPTPIGEADLQAYVDGRLDPLRLREVEAWLAVHPDEARRLAAHREDRRALQAWFAPVLDEPVPLHLQMAARGPGRPGGRDGRDRGSRSEPARRPTGNAADDGDRVHGAGRRLAARWSAGQMATAALMAAATGLLGTGLGWALHARHAGTADGLLATGSQTPDHRAGTHPGDAHDGAQPLAQAADFAQRAAVAHTVFAPEVRRPVEVDAAHEDQLVTWLSKRMGHPMKAAHLQGLGYALEGGRLLPGRTRPVAQFMYRDAGGRRLTLYVSDEIGGVGAGGTGTEPVMTPGQPNMGLLSGRASPPDAPSADAPASETAFRLARQDGLNVFYWVDGRFGYALAADAPREELGRVSAEVYRQLAAQADTPAGPRGRVE